VRWKEGEGPTFSLVYAMPLYKTCCHVTWSYLFFKNK